MLHTLAIRFLVVFRVWVVVDVVLIVKAYILNVSVHIWLVCYG